MVVTGALGGLACLGALGLMLYFADDKIEAKPQLRISSQANSKSPESSPSLSKSGPIEKTSILSGSNDRTTAKASALSDSSGLQLEATGQTSARAVDSHRADGHSSESALPSEADAYYPHIPLAFLNYGGVLPDTEQVATAVQNLQQDFIDATGADTANPADPNFEQAWEWAQPTADEQFYALFGVEAFNAMSIMEASQRGHF